MQSNDEFRRWLNSAKDDLADFRTSYKYKNYTRALYNLQQVSEKLAKAVFTKVGLASENVDPDLKKYFKKYEVEVFTQKQYSHEWKFKFLNQIRKVLTPENTNLLKDFLASFGLDDTKTKVEEATLALKKKISDPDELKSVIVLCNLLLDVAEGKSSDEMKSKLMGINMESILSNISEDSGKWQNMPNIKQIIKNQVSLTYSLIVLLLLSLFLDQFLEARYPNDIDCSPYVPYIKNICSILERCYKLIE